MKWNTVELLLAPLIISQAAATSRLSNDPEMLVLSWAAVGALMGGYIGVMVAPVEDPELATGGQRRRDRHWAFRWLASLILGTVFGALAVLHFEWIPDQMVYTVATAMLIAIGAWSAAKVLASWVPGALRRVLKRIEAVITAAWRQ